MAKMPILGSCRICGIDGPLSKEHVPPQAAFNDCRYIEAKFDQIIGLGPDEIPRGRVREGGVSMYTLCAACNNNTGGWYGKWFVKWCYQGMDILIRSNGKPSLVYLYHSFPLRIIKQIATMFFSINGGQFANKNPELVRFVLDKEKRYLPPKYRFFVYYNLEGHARYAGVSGLSDLTRGKTSTLSEISFPPFGYVLTLDSDPPDKRLFEITHFAKYGYYEFLDTEIRLPVLPTHLSYPGDYRTKDEINRDVQNSSTV